MNNLCELNYCKMFLRNLHLHSVEIYVLENQKFHFKEKLCGFEQSKMEYYPKLYCILCNECDELYSDFKSNFTIKNKVYNDRLSSLFGTKKVIESFDKTNDFNFFEFFELDNSFLIGTKNEIISEMYEKYSLISELNNKIKELNKNKKNLQKEMESLNNNLSIEKNKNNELNNKLNKILNENKESKEKINKIIEQKENEKKLNENLSNKISELQSKGNQLNIEKKELKVNLAKKEKELLNLSKDNKNLGNNVEILKKNLILKENEVNEINKQLNEEKNNVKIISEKLKREERNNKELKNKLENISTNNNENVKKVLNQVEKEQQINKNLESKISELKEQEKENIKKKKELEIQLKNKEVELENIKKNIPQNIGLQFHSDCQTGEYDIILNIKSFKSLLCEGWEIKYNKKEGKQNYLTKKEKPTIVVGVIGNGNKGKSFILEILSRYTIPKGFNVKTEGLSIRYASREDQNIAILDSAGQETPLLKIEKNKCIREAPEKDFRKAEKKEQSENSNIETEESRDEKESCENKEKEEIIKIEKENKSKINMEPETEELEFEKYSRDKLLTEYFLQRFIIFKSNILILVVGNITLTEQKLLSRIKNEVRKLDKTKQIYVIHNLKDFTTDEQVNDYIENTLKKLYKVEIEECIYQNLMDDSYEDKNKYFNKYFIEKGKGVCHFIFINEFSDKVKADYYNKPTIKYIRQEISSIKEKDIFSIIDDCKQFLVKMSEEIMEETPKLEDLITIEDDKNDRIFLKNIKEINLKQFVIDEMGYTLYNESSEPKYSYYINKEDKLFYVNIELPGGGSIEPHINIRNSNYFFKYDGIKKGDELVENDKKSENKKLIGVKNLRKNNKFKVIIQIPCSTMQLKLENDEDLDDIGEMTNDGKGVYTFKYKIILLNEKKEKKKKVFEL